MPRRIGDHDHDQQVIGGVAASVAGISQTANRAALCAMEFIATYFSGQAEVVPDSLYVHAGCSKARYRCSSGANADLWHGIGQALKAGALNLTTRKTTSHLQEKRKDFFTAGDIDIYDFVGNHAADAFADRGASVPEESMRNAELGVSFLRSRATSIPKRMVEVQRIVSLRLGEAKAGHHRVRPAKREPQLQLLLENTDHQLDLKDGLYDIASLPAVISCTRCSQRSSRAGAARWLKAGFCQALSSSFSFTASGQAQVVRRQQQKQQQEQQPRGRRGDLHSSHILMFRGGIWWCGVCGGYSANSGERITTRILRARCRRQPTTAGHYALRRLSRGQTPRPYLQWTHQLAENPDFIIIPKVRLRHKTTLGLEDCVTPVGNLANAPVEQQQEFGDENPFGHMQAGIDSDLEYFPAMPHDVDFQFKMQGRPHLIFSHGQQGVDFR